MPYYKDAENKIHFLDNEAFEYLLPAGSIEITGVEVAELQKLVPLTQEELLAQAKANRAAAYREESDPLFFKAQRGEATMDDWLAKVAEIKARFPEGGA